MAWMSRSWSVRVSTDSRAATKPASPKPFRTTADGTQTTHNSAQEQNTHTHTHTHTHTGGRKQESGVLVDHRIDIQERLTLFGEFGLQFGRQQGQRSSVPQRQSQNRQNPADHHLLSSTFIWTQAEPHIQHWHQLQNYISYIIFIITAGDETKSLKVKMRNFL